mmetsp:Transcript_29288/g.85431  ORF Transcript_29288/g.85431 Transcript_29288/m.85431 type:complete len:216 (+) Transcript_29288:1171-1818(+)
MAQEFCRSRLEHWAGDVQTGGASRSNKNWQASPLPCALGRLEAEGPKPWPICNHESDGSWEPKRSLMFAPRDVAIGGRSAGPSRLPEDSMRRGAGGRTSLGSVPSPSSPPSLRAEPRAAWTCSFCSIALEWLCGEEEEEEPSISSCRTSSSARRRPATAARARSLRTGRDAFCPRRKIRSGELTRVTRPYLRKNTPWTGPVCCSPSGSFLFLPTS